MAKKRITFTRKRVNPLNRKLPAISKPKLGFDGSNVTVTSYAGVPATVLNSASGWISVDCNPSSVIATGSGAAFNVAAGVLGLYSQYRYNSLSLEFIPSVGPASVDAGSRIHIAYIDNAEKMTAFIAAATATRLSMIRGCRNIRTFNAWERFTYRVPLTWRRKEFDTNTTVTNNVDELERSTQGFVLMFVESISAAVGIGTIKADASVRVRELNVTITT